jgi:hypothetical protein
MPQHSVPGLSEFLCDYPLMVLRPGRKDVCLLRGCFKFVAEARGHPVLEDAFDLEIEIPAQFPKVLPRVIETGGRIPRHGDFHVNRDGALCLGSPLRLLLKVSSAPTLCGFAESCLVPYLFAISHKLRNGGALPFGELAHEAPGLIADYVDLFRLKRPAQVLQALDALGMKKRRANKLPCPCGCGRRLGRCRFNEQVRRFRSLAPRSWFRRELYWIVESLRIARARSNPELGPKNFPSSSSKPRRVEVAT